MCGGTATVSLNAGASKGLSPRVRGNRSPELSNSHYPRSIPACAGEPCRRRRSPRWTRVYPRVCGGTSHPSPPRRRGRGLSPRVRGNRFDNGRAAHLAGSIPACAGEPRKDIQQSPPTGVYPRVCGGTPPPPPEYCPLLGLSPRVRGNPAVVRSSVITMRSIPACAGEPRYGRRTRRSIRVYPRVCGGTVSSGIPRATGGGLSPRVRGNRNHGGNRGDRQGSIPACAGEPTTCHWRERRETVYPRVCGGTCSDTANGKRVTGLSPRVRGNQYEGDGRQYSRGSIPACAGEPVAANAHPYGGAVYPRVCGGTIMRAAGDSRDWGLSPRVRGNLTALQNDIRYEGSIPACAGEPFVGLALSREGRVYPRVCGGTLRSHRKPTFQSGLSPRVRGNLRLRQRLRIGERSIPACAGEPSLAGVPSGRTRVYPRVCGGT